MQRSLSAREKWLPLESEVLLLCSGSFGSWPVGFFVHTLPRILLMFGRRNFLGLLRQRHCQGHWSHSLASPTWFGVHPILHTHVGYLLLPQFLLWLMKHGRHAEGFKSMSRLRARPIIAARDFYYSCVIYEVEVRESHGSGYFTRLWDCFAVPRIRRANYGASTVMLAQQMCGINSKSILIPCQSYQCQN